MIVKSIPKRLCRRQHVCASGPLNNSELGMVFLNWRELKISHQSCYKWAEPEVFFLNSWTLFLCQDAIPSHLSHTSTLPSRQIWDSPSLLHRLSDPAGCWLHNREREIFINHQSAFYLFIFFLVKPQRSADSDKAPSNSASVRLNPDWIRASPKIYQRKRGLCGSWQHIHAPEWIMGEALRNQYL